MQKKMYTTYAVWCVFVVLCCYKNVLCHEVVRVNKHRTFSYGGSRYWASMWVCVAILLYSNPLIHVQHSNIPMILCQFKMPLFYLFTLKKIHWRNDFFYSNGYIHALLNFFWNKWHWNVLFPMNILEHIIGMKI